MIVFDYSTDQLKLYLAHKAIKDLIIHSNLTSFDAKTIDDLFFKPGRALASEMKQPQGNQARMLDFANAIMSYMYTFTIDAIVDNNLPFSYPLEFLKLQRDPVSLMAKGQDAEVSVLQYFLANTAFGSGIKQTSEPVNKYDNFKDYLPIVVPDQVRSN